MRISTFDIEYGAYAFAESMLATTEHQHPALEIIIARTGTFQLMDASGVAHKLSAAIVPANVLHTIDSHGTPCEIWMFENEQAVIPLLVEELGPFDPRADILPVGEEKVSKLSPMFFQLLKFANAQYDKGDERVERCKKYISTNYQSATLQHDELAKMVHLSPSRLSHLFKRSVGVSIKKYIIWIRLKHAIQANLEQNVSLLEAGYAAGFYDAAHFSKAFQKFFGVNPSVDYNRTTERS